MRGRWLIATAVAAALAATEIGVRVAGATDFPLYRNDPVLGYVPAPDQRGAFMGRDWAYNEHSMGVAYPYRHGDRDLVLIGDSVVNGGNPYRQQDKLGPQLRRASQRPVWPIGAGSWALMNELAYLRIHPDVQGSTVFVLNSADFVTPSVWRTELTHPTHSPLCAVCYIAQKVISPKLPHGPPAPDNLPTTAWLDDWAKYHPATPVLVVAYPTRAEAADAKLRHKMLAPAWRLRRPGVSVLDLGADPRWTLALYHDDIHPSPQGMAVLAKIITERVAESAP